MPLWVLRSAIEMVPVVAVAVSVMGSPVVGSAKVTGFGLGV